MKKIAIIMLALVLVGCGAPIQKSSSGLVEDTKIIIVGEKLTGLDVSIGDLLNKKISRHDLNRYQYGTLGSSNSEKEDLHQVVILISAGEHRVLVTDGEQVRYDKKLYFGSGQTREVRIR